MVILVLATNTAPERPQLPVAVALAIFLVKGGIYKILLKRIFSSRLRNSVRYSSAERQGSILAIVFFCLDVYLLNCQYYLSLLPMARKMPAVADLVGLLLFVGYLSMMWAAANPCYNRIFGRSHSTFSFIKNNIETNLPIVLPWILLSLFADLLRLSSLPLVKEVLSSSWGEPIVSLLFFLCLVLTFPVIIVKIWGCTPMPDGPERRRIASFCERHGVKYSNIMLWPMLEGQALTAGVMGVIPQYRYLLVTPALMEALTPEEIEAVMAHELGHVKKRHLQLYILLFLGFGLLAQLSSYPILYLLSNSTLFYKMVHFANKRPGNALYIANTVAMFVLMIVYFRYVLGFFMRNFERQADLFALMAMKTAGPLIMVFEKIAWLSGLGRDQPSWHHFGLGQRIDFLKSCELDHGKATRHNRKVYGSLIAYALILVLSALTLWRMPDNLLAGAPQEKYAQAVIQQKMSDEPGNYVWPQLLGDLQYGLKHYVAAVTAYRKSLKLNPNNPEALNNLAWLLLTSDDPSIHDQVAALKLAEQAVIELPAPHILDTLAQAYWANGRVEQAILSEKRALAQNPPDPDYYLQQLRKFLSHKEPASPGID